MTSRRAFLTRTVAALLATPSLAGRATAAKMWRIGWLDHLGVAQEYQAPFVRALRELGYAEMREFALEARHADWKFDRLPELATDLVSRKVDLIVAFKDPAISAAQQSTKTLPIIMVGSADPVGLGFATSLGRPGGNVTGLSDAGADLVGKQLDLLKKAVPRLRQVSILTSAADGAKERARQRALQPAQALGISLRVDEVGDRAGVDQIFASARNQHPDGVLVLSAELFDYASLSRMAKLARQEKIPLASDWEITTTEGGLISYGASYAPQAQRAASYADKILKGASPSDLPIEQPTEFRLVVNLDTARALGLSIPQSILLLADDVIE